MADGSRIKKGENNEQSIHSGMDFDRSGSNRRNIFYRKRLVSLGVNIAMCNNAVGKETVERGPKSGE